MRCAVVAMAVGIVLPTAPAAAAPPPGCAPPTDGLVARWRGELTARDSVGSHHGALEGVASFRPGVLGSAFSLPDDYVSVPDDGDLDITGDLTLETWLQIDDVRFGDPGERGIGGDRVIFWSPDTADEAPTFALWIEGDGRTAVAAPLSFASGPRSDPTTRVLSNALEWRAGTWYHVAVTRAGNTVGFYRDGLPVGTATIGGTPQTSSAPLALGAAPVGDTVYNPLKGALDEPGVWSNALSPGEIQTIFQTATGDCSAGPGATPPATTIDGPANGTEITPASPFPVYELGSDDPGVRLECRAYNNLSPASDFARQWAPCTSPYTVATDTSVPGNYVVQVRATDEDGNPDPTPAERWLVHHARQDVPPDDRKPDRCTPIPVLDVESPGPELIPGCRLSQIRRGKVPCMRIETGELARCRFHHHSGRLVRSTRGRRYAVIGQPITKQGEPGGTYLVATRRGQFQRVPCATKPKALAHAADTAGRVEVGRELSQVCVVEDILAEYNTLTEYGWKQIYNYATLDVCTSHNPDVNPHPDLAQFVGVNAAGSFCYTGFGAALNDINGTERDWTGGYISGPEFCHMIVSGGYETYGAKRPATRSFPYPPIVKENTPVVWRAVNANIDIANSQSPDPPEAPPDPEIVY